MSYFLNITAFCKDNNETALEVEQDILNSFRKNGFELISPRFNHMRNFLTCLPFMAGKGLFKQLKEAGVVQRAESFNVANLMPLVADNPLTPAGLLAPTYRNQLAFIDIFFRGMNNTNYNMAVCGPCVRTWVAYIWTVKPCVLTRLRTSPILTSQRSVSVTSCQ